MQHLVVIAVTWSTVRRETAVSGLAGRRNTELKTERSCYSRRQQVAGRVYRAGAADQVQGRLTT